jgi:iron complex outermembrane recepter protein
LGHVTDFGSMGVYCSRPIELAMSASEVIGSSPAWALVLAAALIGVAESAGATSADAQTVASSTTTDASQGQLEQIVVTVQKRRESLQDVPVTVAPLTGMELTQNAITDLFQAVTMVPGAIFSRAPDDGLALTFRGLGAAARPQAFEQSVALFDDGVFLGKGRLYTATLFDIEQMEFIEGTQSTLLGKNASVGAISVLSRQPGNVFSIDSSAGHEFVNGGYVVDTAADLPASDTFTTRIAIHYNDLNGSVHNTITGNNVPIDEDSGLRITSRWNVTDVFGFTASYQFEHLERIGTGMQLIGPVPPGVGDGVLNGTESELTVRTPSGDSEHGTVSQIVSLKGELQLGDFALISQTAYVHYHLFNDDNLDFSPDPDIDFQRGEHYNQYTQELRFQSGTAQPFQYMTGAFFMNSYWDSLENQLWGVPDFPPPPAATSGQLFNGPFSNHFVQDTHTYSGFASGKYEITNQFSAAGGVRYTRELKDATYGRVPLAPLTIWNTIANPPFDLTPLYHASSFLDGNFSLDYRVTSAVSFYAAFGHGSKSGGYVETNSIAIPPTALVNGKVPPALVAAGSQIADEFTKTYEVGMKSTFLERRLRLNVALFKTDIQGFQNTLFTGGPLGFVTFNAPASSQGVEFESAFQVMSNFRLDASMTYADAMEVLHPIVDGAFIVDSNGDRISEPFRRPQAPPLIYNLGAEHRAPITSTLEADFGLHVRHRNAMYNQAQETFRSEPLTTLDLSAGIDASNGRWGVELTAKNVTNAIAADFQGPSVDPRFYSEATPNQGRTVLLTVRAHY